MVTDIDNYRHCVSWRLCVCPCMMGRPFVREVCALCLVSTDICHQTFVSTVSVGVAKILSEGIRNQGKKNLKVTQENITKNSCKKE